MKAPVYEQSESGWERSVSQFNMRPFRVIYYGRKNNVLSNLSQYLDNPRGELILLEYFHLIYEDVGIGGIIVSSMNYCARFNNQRHK